MQLSRFNWLLTGLSNSYTQLLNLRDDLLQFSQTDLLLGVCEMDNAKKGWLKKEDLLSFIHLKIRNEKPVKTIKTIQTNMQIQRKEDNKNLETFDINISEVQLAKFLNEMFLSDRIAYTMVISFCLGQEDSSILQRSKHFKSNLKSSMMKKSYKPQNILGSILIELSHIHCLVPETIQLIPKYIPSKLKRVTIQQLAKYIFSQNLGVDANIIMGILNNQSKIDSKSKELVHQYYNEETNDFIAKEDDKQNADEHILQLMKMSQRLVSRVNNFGNQWLFKTQAQSEQIN